MDKDLGIFILGVICGSGITVLGTILISMIIEEVVENKIKKFNR